MSTPKPAALETKIAELGRVCAELYAEAGKLREPYGWAYPYGLQPTVVESAGGKTQIWSSNPTLGVIESEHKARVRTKCLEAVAAVDDAIKAINRAEDGAIAIVQAAQSGLRGVLPKPNLEAEKELLRFGRKNRGTVLEDGELAESTSKQRGRQSQVAGDDGWQDPTAVGGFGEN